MATEFDMKERMRAAQVKFIASLSSTGSMHAQVKFIASLRSNFCWIRQNLNRMYPSVMVIRFQKSQRQLFVLFVGIQILKVLYLNSSPGNKKSRFASFVERGPPSWEVPRSDKKHLSIAIRGMTDPSCESPLSSRRKLMSTCKSRISNLIFPMCQCGTLCARSRPFIQWIPLHLCLGLNIRAVWSSDGPHVQ